MNESISNKTAIIWGASGGIGRAILKKLNDSGWETIAVSRQPDSIEEIATHSLEADVGQPASVEQAIYLAGLEVDSIDLFVYAAGDIAQAKVTDMKLADWKRLLDANLTGAFLATHATLPLLSAQAHMVFIGAVSERLQLPSLSAYVSAKAGLEAFTATLRKEQRKQKVSLIRPGAVDTAFWDKVSLRKPKDAADPAKIADKIMQAYDEGHSGVLDITH